MKFSGTGSQGGGYSSSSWYYNYNTNISYSCLEDNASSYYVCPAMVIDVTK